MDKLPEQDIDKLIKQDNTELSEIDIGTIISNG